MLSFGFAHRMLGLILVVMFWLFNVTVFRFHCSRCMDSFGKVYDEFEGSCSILSTLVRSVSSQWLYVGVLSRVDLVLVLVSSMFGSLSVYDSIALGPLFILYLLWFMKGCLR